jgi:hypothetical protein
VATSSVVGVATSSVVGVATSSVGVASGFSRKATGGVWIWPNCRSRLAGDTGSFHDVFKLVGKDSHRTYWLVAEGHYLFAADGTVKVSRDTLSAECR